jgi:hypothetical protein
MNNQLRNQPHRNISVRVRFEFSAFPPPPSPSPTTPPIFSYRSLEVLANVVSHRRRHRTLTPGRPAKRAVVARGHAPGPVGQQEQLRQRPTNTHIYTYRKNPKVNNEDSRACGL